MTDFIDRAKLEAEAEKRWPLWLPTGDYETDREDYSETDAKWQNAEAEEQRQAFLAGAAAYAALLGSETTEEWGVLMDGTVSKALNFRPYTEADARASAEGLRLYEAQAVSRRVTPWLPSEGGEKP